MLLKTNLRGTEKVKHAVLQWMKENKPRQHDKFFSQRELAKMLYVDPMTAHKALNELTADGILYRIKGKGSFIGPDPAIIKGLRLVLVSPGVHYESPENNPDNWHVVQREINSIMHNLRDSDSFSTLIVKPDKHTISDVMRLSKYDAIFFMGYQEFNKLIDELIEHRATVIIDNIVKGDDVKCIKIYRPLQQDVRTGISYLIKRGYNKIAYIGSSSPDVKSKFAGYLQALDDYGIEFNENLVVNNINHQNEGAKAAAILYNRKVKFDAVFVDTDLKAVGVIEYFTQAGLKVPEDIGVMGFDGLEHCIGAPLYLTSVKPANNVVLANVIEHIRKNNGDLTTFDVPQIPGKIIKNRTTN